MCYSVQYHCGGKLALVSMGKVLGPSVEHTPQSCPIQWVRQLEYYMLSPPPLINGKELFLAGVNSQHLPPPPFCNSRVRLRIQRCIHPQWHWAGAQRSVRNIDGWDTGRGWWAHQEETGKKCYNTWLEATDNVELYPATPKCSGTYCQMNKSCLQNIR